MKHHPSIALLPLLLLSAAAAAAAAATSPAAPPRMVAPTSGAGGGATPPLPVLLLDRDATPTVVQPGRDVVVYAKGGTTTTSSPPNLLYRVNFGPESEVPFSRGGGAGDSGVWSARIATAGSGIKSGDLLRWRMRVAPNLYDPPEQDPPPPPPPAAPKPRPGSQPPALPPRFPQQQQPPPRQRYVGALVSSSPGPLIPQPPLLEPSPYSQRNLAELASPAIPEIHWWAPNEQAAISDPGAPGSVLYLPPLPSSDGAGNSNSSSSFGRIYDAVHSERRGVTALAWKKPKLKFTLPGGSGDDSADPAGGGQNNRNATAASASPQRFLVSFAPEKGTKTLKLNSYHAELGDGPSMLREAVALAVLRETGVPAPATFYVRVFLNGRLLGLFGVVEDVDSQFLARRGLPSGPNNAPLFESVSGEMSNLRGDLPASEAPSFYGKAGGGDPEAKEDWRQLELFARGLAGAGAPGDTSDPPSGPLLGRRLFLLDSVDLPAAVNEAAAQTVLGNMDRCTKNFYVYRDPRTALWYRFPWDVEASMGQDNGLGGKPGPLYAVLADEQWNSPLYCDAQHPQDIDAASRPGLNTYFGSARGAARDHSSSSGSSSSSSSSSSSASAGRINNRRRRRLQQQQGDRLLAEGAPLQPGGWPEPKGWADPDAVPPGVGLVRLGGSGPPPRRGSGAPYTYNHLTAALFDVPETRAMYLRRLRTLADVYLGGDQPRLALLTRAAWSKISAAAQEDAKLWARSDPSRGVQQVLTEYVPIRARQLLHTYAPGGVRPLLPSPSASASVRLARFEGGGQSAFLEVRNDADPSGGAEAAVDASGWEVRWTGNDGAASSWRLPVGFVVPPGRSLFLAGDGRAFRARAASPRGGEGSAFVPVFPPAPGVVGGPPGAAVGQGGFPAAAGGGKWELLGPAGAVVSTL